MIGPYPESTLDFEPELVARGTRELSALGEMLSAADPEGLVAPRSRVLCAGLGHLGVLGLRALGGGPSEEAVSRAAALLSLVTKVDDQVIDALPFHGGSETPGDVARRRTSCYLDATFAAIVDGRAGSARLELAAELGRRLRALASTPARLEAMFGTIAEGFAIQAEAVATLTRHPAHVSLEQVSRVTRDISGAWLHMITAVGALPSDARRALTPGEKGGFFAWGSAIQRADALADLEKDLADGHLSTYPGRVLFDRRPVEYLEATRTIDGDALYALVHAEGVDEACLGDTGEDPRALEELGALGGVSSLLAWIRHYLVCRYRAHPRARGAAYVVTPGRAVLFPAASRGLACSGR
jgi:hypothetical protein